MPSHDRGMKSAPPEVQPLTTKFLPAANELPLPELPKVACSLSL